MKALTKFKTLIEHQGMFYRVLGEHKEDNVDETRLGELVHWYGGDKVLKYKKKYLICKTIQDAILG